MNLEELKRIANRPLGFSLMGATAFDVKKLKGKIDGLREKKAEAIEKNAQGYGTLARLYKDKAALKYSGNTPNQNLDRRDWEGFVNSNLMRAVAQGLHRAGPGLANALGMAAGVVNGNYHGIARLLGADTSFMDGYRKSVDFADKYYAEPLRYAQMYYGGKKIKNALDDMNDFYRKRILDRKGPAADKNGVRNKEYWDAVENMNGIKSVGKGVSTLTEILAQWPVAGGIAGKLLGWLGKGATMLKGAPAVQKVMSRAAPISKTVSKSIPTISKYAPRVGDAAGAMASSPYVVAPAWGALDSRNEWLRRRGEYDFVTKGLDEYAKSRQKVQKMFPQIMAEKDPDKRNKLTGEAFRIASDAEERREKNRNSWGQFIRK